ncbi:hypothetical protein J3R30DRAFT_3462072 [Lentinula aciculospora]|uniref:Uncharacterized protein n=1 Tax=Lentinula aciculospora TaxID=153920 RepID=A0A9W9AFH0_9AGAR|nr:hypothetical protein J3R30DRAFT_3462072 [Lentinula aciculospora]
MKLSTCSFILAGVGLLQANASPLRIVFVSHEASVNSPSGSNNESVAQIQVHPHKHHNLQLLNEKENGSRPGCADSRSLSISNTLRQALGLPLIETEFVHPHEGSKIEGAVHFLPFAFGGPVLEHDDDNDNDEGRIHHNHHYHNHQDEELEEGEGEGPLHHNHHHHHHDKFKSMEENEGEGPIHHHRHHHHKFRSGPFPRRTSFMRRLHFSLMTLGPWEGRAVAFVLGCGLGVLLRMLWVLTVVAYRTVRGDNSTQEPLFIALPNQYDAEEVFVPPPVYILDDKTPLQESS